MDSTSELSKLSNLNLEEGIWAVTKIPNGIHYKYITDKVDDLPKKSTSLQLESYRYKIANNIRDYLTPLFRTGPLFPDAIKIDEIMKVIFNALEEE